MLFSQDRARLRQAYAEAWRKFSAGLPLEPLEAQIAAVVAEHPEYQRLIEQPDRAMDRDWTPEGGETNPFLHMGMHLAIREQVATDRPAGINRLHRTLGERLEGTHEAEHRMMEALGEVLWTAQREGLPPDEAAYLEALRRLAGR